MTAPTLSVPELGGSSLPEAPVSPTVYSPNTSTDSGSSGYTLGVPEAMSSLQAGYALAGLNPNGGEVFVTRILNTEHETKSVYDEKCEYEYDIYEQKNIYKCKQELVTKSVPVNKTAFQVSGSGIGTVEFATANSAIDRAVQLGVTRWRMSGGRSPTPP